MRAVPSPRRRGGDGARRGWGAGCTVTAAARRGRGEEGTRTVPSPWAAGVPSVGCAGVSASLSLHSRVSNVLSSSEISSTFRLVSAGGTEGTRVTPVPASHRSPGPGVPLILTDLGADVLDVLRRAERRLAEDGLRRGAGRRAQEGVVADAGGVDGEDVGAGLGLVHPGDVVAGPLLAQELGGEPSAAAVTAGTQVSPRLRNPLRGLTRTSASLARPVRSHREPFT